MASVIWKQKARYKNLTTDIIITQVKISQLVEKSHNL